MHAGNEGEARPALYVPTLDEARLKAEFGGRFALIQRQRLHLTLVERAVSEYREKTYLTQYTSEAWRLWCRAHKGFCFHYRNERTCQQWPEFVEAAVKALRSLGCDLPQEEIMKRPEVLYIGLVEAYVKPGFRTDVTSKLGEVLAYVPERAAA